jgi:hypothetical protein
MKHIEINILQFLALLIFIFLFTYCWLPKINIQKTTEYRKLALKYIKLLDERNNWQNLYMQVINKNNYNMPDYSNFNLIDSAIGNKNSAHSNPITPRNIDTNDNHIVNKFFN